MGSVAMLFSTCRLCFYQRNKVVVMSKTIYCPICGRNLTAINSQEVASGKADSYVFVHDNIIHSDSDIDALENGIN